MRRTRKEPGDNPSAPRRASQADSTVESGAGKSPTDNIRIELDLARKLNIASKILGKTVSELISPHIRDWVEQLYADAVKKAQQDVKENLK